MDRADRLAAPVLTGLEPVRRIPSDGADDEPEEGMALCLSGGGYRAMLFHLGGLWRLNELGLLATLKRVSSVSGGSITAAALAAAWEKLTFDSDARRQHLVEEVVKPVCDLASRTIDVSAVVTGLLAPGSIAERIAGHYRRQLFPGLTLQDLPPPPAPLFVINATNVQSGVLCRFTRPYIWDYRVGKIENPTLDLATAVAASSAFPPFLSPLELSFAEGSFVPGSGTDLEQAAFTRRVVLTDGGVYDNLGLETAWKRYRTILVSDGGGALEAEERPRRLWPLHSLRTLFLIDSQVRALRKRQLIASYKAKDSSGTALRTGTYWGIRSHQSDYHLSNPLPIPPDSKALAEVPTRLKALPDRTQKRLINWGYVIADTALRKHMVEADKPDSVPYPEEA